MLEQEGGRVERIPGPHCYQFFMGSDEFARTAADEPGCLYLTDYLVRHFDRLIIAGLGLDRHPELRDLYFGNYTRLIYIAQTEDERLRRKARAAAARLGLAFEVRYRGYGELAGFVQKALAPGEGRAAPSRLNRPDIRSPSGPSRSMVERGLSRTGSPQMPVIDSQVHAYERDHPGRPWVGVLAGPPEVTGDDMVAAMDNVGVDGALLVSPYSMYRFDASYALEVHRAHRGRFGLIKPVDPTDPCGRRRD